MDCLVRGVTKSWTQLSDFRVMMSAGGMQSTLLLLLTSVFALGSSKVAVGFFGFFFKLILFLAVLGLAAVHQPSLVAESGDYSPGAVHGLLIVVASLVAEPGLQGTPTSVAAVSGSRAQVW